MKFPRLRTILLTPFVLFALVYIAAAVTLAWKGDSIAVFEKPTATYETITIFGASGTAGDGVLKAALANPDIRKIHVITRRATPRIEEGVASGKVEMTLHMNYLDYSAIRERIADADAAYWAIGISSLGVARGWSYDRAGLFQPDSVASPALTRSELEALVMDPADRVTFMCAPWGSGERIGIDGDLDGILNADEA
jgi:hypothetical protein